MNKTTEVQTCTNCKHNQCDIHDFPCVFCFDENWEPAEPKEPTQLDRIEKMLEALVGLSKSKDCSGCIHVDTPYDHNNPCHKCNQGDMWE